MSTRRLQGIAVTGSDETNGTWQYSTNNGTTWLALGAVSPGSARLLESSATTKLRFVPNADFNGTATITLRAWDQTFGANGALTGTTVNGGTTAFSVATDSASLTVTAVNDAPVAVNGSVTTDEDTDHVFGASDFNFTDPNDSPPTASRGGHHQPADGRHAALRRRRGRDRRPAADRERRRPARRQARLPPGGQRQRHPLRDLRLPHPGQRRHPRGGDDTSDNMATETVNVTEVNDAPTAVDDTTSTPEDTALVFDPRTNDSTGSSQRVDPDAHHHGRSAARRTARAADHRQRPNAGKSLHPGGQLQRPRQLHLHDHRQRHDQRRRTQADTATVNVTVTEVNDAPTAVDDSTTVAEDGARHLRPAHQRRDGSGQRVWPDADHHRRSAQGTHGTVIIDRGDA